MIDHDSALGQVTKARGHLPTDDAVVKLLRLAIISVEDQGPASAPPGGSRPESAPTRPPGSSKASVIFTGSEAGSAECVGVAFAPVAEGRRGCSGDVLDVVGDVHGAASAEDLVEAFHELRLLGRGSPLNASLGEFVRGHVLEVDPASGHLGDGRDLLARGQGLRAGKEVPSSSAISPGWTGSEPRRWRVSALEVGLSAAASM